MTDCHIMRLYTLIGEDVMQEYNIQQAQKEYNEEIVLLKNSGTYLSEAQEAICFAKILIKQTTYSRENIVFCNDSEFFVSKTPTGYDVVGYYIRNIGTKNPFTVTVCKINNLWYPSKKYIAADTKSCSNSILLWVLLSLGWTLMGILMYFLMSAAIGI